MTQIAAYLASVFSSGLVLQIMLSFASDGTGETMSETFYFPIVLAVVAIYTSIPSLVFAAICERKAIRHPAAYLAFSTLLAFAAFPLQFQSLEPDILLMALYVTPAGFVAGLVYWHIAGRYSGEESERLRKQIEVFD